MSEELLKPKWPWFALGALVLAILLAILWMTREVENVRRIRSSTTGQTSSVIKHKAPVGSRLA